MTRAREGRSIRWLALLVACMTACGAAARADLPGSLPLSAAGQGHLWWVVRSEPTLDRTGAPIEGAVPTWALMHHATEEPAPTERLVMRFPIEPAAIAAERDRVVVIARAEAGQQGAGLFVTTMYAAKNEAVGHWFTLPRGAPIVLPAPPVDGDVRGAAVAGDTLGLLVRVRRSQSGEPERLWFGTLACESEAGRAWKEQPLPPLDRAEPMHLLTRAWYVGVGSVASGSVPAGPAGSSGGGSGAASGASSFALLGSHPGDGASMLMVLRQGLWVEESVQRAGAAIAARGVLGGFEVAGRLVITERVRSDHPVGRVRLGLVRERVLQPWAEFDEPERPWMVGPFGDRAVVLEIGDRARASTGMLGFSDGGPGQAIALAPPGFASGSWIHLPILGILSVGLVLAAVIFGAEAYLDTARGVGRPDRKARGAVLSRRALALFIDMLPGLVGVWFFVRGTPFDLLRIPAFQPDLAACVPALVVFGTGWVVASVGDVVFGRSMGKRVVGLRIMSVHGGPASFGRRALRSLVSVIPIMSPLVMLVALLNPRGDGPAEMLTRTAVVDASEPEARPSPPADGDSGQVGEGPDGGNRPG